MSEPIVHDAPSKNAEAVPLACEMARALGELASIYEKHWKLTREEASARVFAVDDRTIERILATPPSQISFVDLFTLAKHAPELSSKRWMEILQAAKNELQTGFRAASIVANPSASSCWPKARFLALRTELLEGWQPRNSVERLLVDALAQTQSQYEHWLELLTSRTLLQAVYERTDDGKWNTPRVDDSKAIEQAASMVERFHRLMMRTIRSLQNLRRNAPVVMVQNARQVNVGQQQINGVSGA